MYQLRRGRGRATVDSYRSDCTVSLPRCITVHTVDHLTYPHVRVTPSRILGVELRARED